MAQKTKTYKLEYFIRGSAYSASSDKRRFTAVDSNIESIVGIVGVGVISGWKINHLYNKTIQITPGKGIINGYFAESPYSIKQRSSLVAPEIEIEPISLVNSAIGNLNQSQETEYIKVVRLYNPSFNPTTPIENSYIKFVNLSSSRVDNPYKNAELSLFDNSINFIYAELPDGYKPYPALTDEELKSYSFTKPILADYVNATDYLTDLAIYNNNIAAYQNYKWQSHAENRFTEVIFKIYTSRQFSKNKVLLGAATVANNNVQSVDYSEVRNLENIRTEIEANSKFYIKNHQHGGNKNYDPEKIELKTDLREAVLRSYDKNNGVGLFDVLNKNKTSTEKSHNHKYKIDANGNGYTIGTFGDSPSHTHTITEYNLDSLNDHTHTIPTSKDNNVILVDNSFNVYSGKTIIGTQDSSNIKLNFNENTLTIYSGVKLKYNL